MEKESTGIRRSDRVTVSIPLEVAGTDASGEGFFDGAETLRISRHGASIVLNRKLAPDQELTLRNLENNREAEVSVIGQIGTAERGEVYGVAFAQEETNLWDIEFPPLAESDQAASRVVMACMACKGREVAYLNELETEVFQSSGVLQRSCSRCRQSTVWRESSGPEPVAESSAPAETARPGVVAGPTAAHGPQAVSVAEAMGSHVHEHEADDEPSEPRTQNDRKHVRSKLTITVCIRAFREGKDQWGSEDEVLETADVSRGGFGFETERRYRKGSHVEVAIPYKAGAANIFVPAKIANVRRQKSGKRRYGVAYIPTHKGWPGG